MIKHSNKNIGSVYQGGKVISSIWYGARLVWEWVIGCFTKGYWINKERWTNNQGWKNN